MHPSKSWGQASRPCHIFPFVALPWKNCRPDTLAEVARPDGGYFPVGILFTDRQGAIRIEDAVLGGVTKDLSLVDDCESKLKYMPVKLDQCQKILALTQWWIF